MMVQKRSWKQEDLQMTAPPTAPLSNQHGLYQMHFDSQTIPPTQRQTFQEVLCKSVFLPGQVELVWHGWVTVIDEQVPEGWYDLDMVTVRKPLHGEEHVPQLLQPIA